MKILYPAGYLITVESWENDADNYNTETYHTRSEAHARAVVKFANVFKSQNNSKHGIGNMYEPDDEELDRADRTLREFYKENPAISEVSGWDPIDDENVVSWLIDFAAELGLSCGEYYTRVCSRVDAIRFPMDVYAEDLTEEFTK